MFLNSMELLILSPKSEDQKPPEEPKVELKPKKQNPKKLEKDRLKRIQEKEQAKLE